MIWRWIWYSLIGRFFKPKEDKVAYITYDSYLNTHFDFLICEEINAWRKENMLPQLQMDTSRVIDIAENHAWWLLNNIMDEADLKKRAHYSFSKREEQIRLDFPDVNIGENIAMGYKSPSSMVGAWAKSPSHKAIMAGDYTHVAIASLANFYVTIYTKR